jgi:hypothetical protein
MIRLLKLLVICHVVVVVVVSLLKIQKYRPKNLFTSGGLMIVVRNYSFIDSK